MKKGILTILLLSALFSTFGQISSSDSTVQVVAYWEKAEKQLYSAVYEEIKLKGSDTTSKDITSYDIEVTVLGQSENSYTVQWVVMNFKTSSNDLDARKIGTILNDLKIVFTTNDVGTFAEVTNWKDIKNHINKRVEELKRTEKISNEFSDALNQLQTNYSTKEMIESAQIKDIQQFLFFHGGKYKLGEVFEGQGKFQNLMGGEPFDADLKVWLSEINEKESTYLMQSTQKVNVGQLKKSALDYYTKIARSKSEKPPKIEDLGDLKNETSINSQIHDGGWVVSTTQTVVVTSDQQTYVERRTMELK